jgi:amidase
VFTSPRVEDVIAVADGLGLRLAAGEAELMQHSLAAQLELLDSFVQSRDVEETAPSCPPPRERGNRPRNDEDPLNAWLWRCDITDGSAAGILSGRTVSFKDTIPVAGLPLTFGSFTMDGWIADVDATVVTRVLQAGGRIIGKNACSGFSGGLGNGGRIGDYYRPVNPNASGRICGGSSSGSAVAVAGGEVDIAFGGDQGGSVRMPAAYCGALGLKPTFGLIPCTAVASTFDQSLDYLGPMTRTARDAAIALEAVAGYDGLDPRQGRDIPERLDVQSHLDDPVTGVRIGVLEEGFAGVADDVRQAVTAAAGALATLGAVVSTVSVPAHDHIGGAYTGLMTEGALAIRGTGPFGAFARTWYPEVLSEALYRVHHGESGQLGLRLRSELVLAEFSRRLYHGRVYAKAQNVRPAYTAAYDRVLSEVDVLVMPTVPTVAQEVPDERDVDRRTLTERSLRAGLPAHVRNTAPFNYTGHPALAVPCQPAGALPMSMQLVGRRLDDALLLRVARAYQEDCR